jgi:hypothetical protein
LNAALDALVTAIAGETGLTNVIRGAINLMHKFPGLGRERPVMSNLEMAMPQRNAIWKDVKHQWEKNLPRRSYRSVNTRDGRGAALFTHGKSNQPGYEQY